MLAPAHSEQAVLTQGALDGHVTEGQIQLASEALSAEGEKLAPQATPCSASSPVILCGQKWGARESSCRSGNPCAW